LSCYLRLVDSSSRMIRAGKASLEADLAPIFQRLGLDQGVLESTVAKLFEPRRRIPNRRGARPAVAGRSDARADGKRRLSARQLVN
jgi:hypothetical protein